MRIVISCSILCGLMIVLLSYRLLAAPVVPMVAAAPIVLDEASDQIAIDKAKPTMKKWAKELGVKKCSGCHSRRGKGLAKYKQETSSTKSGKICKKKFVEKLFFKTKEGKYEKVSCKNCHEGKRFIF